MAAESLLEKMHFLLKQKRDQRKRFMVGEKSILEQKLAAYSRIRQKILSANIKK
jgi:hypothetical protein